MRTVAVDTAVLLRCSISLCTPTPCLQERVATLEAQAAADGDAAAQVAALQTDLEDILGQRELVLLERDAARQQAEVAAAQAADLQAQLEAAQATATGSLALEQQLAEALVTAEEATGRVAQAEEYAQQQEAAAAAAAARVAELEAALTAGAGEEAAVAAELQQQNLALTAEVHQLQAAAAAAEQQEALAEALKQQNEALTARVAELEAAAVAAAAAAAGGSSGSHQMVEDLQRENHNLQVWLCSECESCCCCRCSDRHHSQRDSPLWPLSACTPLP